jgi:predicted nucleotidyltransferase
VVAVVVVGSYARGDFNKWSDVDLLVVAKSLPERFLDRFALFDDAPPRFQVVSYTPHECRQGLRRRNKMFEDAAAYGVVLAGVLPVSE